MKKRQSKLRIFSLLAGPLSLLFCSLLIPAPFPVCAAVGVVVWMALWWVTAPVDYAVTAFLPVIVNALLEIIPMKALIANYASETIMLLLGASILTVSWQETGLDRRIATGLLGGVGGNCRKQLFFWTLLAFGLSAILPNAIVCAMLTPIAVAMLHHAGTVSIRKDRFASKLLLCIAYATGVGGLVTPLGGAMNLVAIDYIQQVTGSEYMYAKWLVRYWPVVLILLVSNIVFMMWGIGKADRVGEVSRFFKKEYSVTSKMSGAEIWSLLVFVFAMVLVFLRPLYRDILPGMKPAYVFLSCAVVSFFAGKKNGARVLLWKNVQQKIVWELIYIFAGGLAAGALINDSGAAAWIGEGVAHCGLTGGVGTVIVILVFTLLLSDVTSNTATAAVAIPIVISVVSGIGKDPLPYIYIATIGVNLSYMLPTSIRSIPVGYGVSPEYMFRIGWKISVMVIVLMTVVCSFWL